jgi:hypothetical protein
MIRTVLTISFLAALAAGCYAQDGVAVGYSGGYSSGYATAPGMVYVGPGVQVVSDYDYPVFYSEGAYWRFDNGVWYRSGMYNGGWSVSYNVPVGVRGIDRPYSYSHYRGNGDVRFGGNAGYGRPAPGYGNPNGGYGGGPVVRDHREGGGYRPPPAPPSAPAPVYRPSIPTNRAPVRDHRR